MLVNSYEILKHAQDNKYGVGAFNVNNMEIAQAVINAAEALNAPVILQVTQGAIKYAGIEYISSIAQLAANKASVPVALHLDHGTDFEIIMECLRNGFTSVMIDGSKFPLEENIEKTKKVVEIAHAMGVSVEGELGKIAGTEDQVHVEAKDAAYTDPQEAKRFYEETNVDALAIAVGTAHGVYKGEPKIDYDRISEIRAVVDCPLVLHGSSGVPYEALTKAVSLGICKINIDTDIRMAFANSVRKFLDENPNEYDPRKILGPSREAMQAVVEEKIKVFKSDNKAWK
ncbi:MAG: class II fructose-1,6-bisphosphate aldolase [Tissierellia bacterium]|nr:class II fructose-1,6-bisphosphate aldolase [Tissierellia bacterium]